MRKTFLLLALLAALVVGCDDTADSTGSASPAAALTEAQRAELASMMSSAHAVVTEQAASAQSISDAKPALRAALDAQSSPRLRNVILENDDEFVMADSGSYAWSYDGGSPVATVSGTSIFEGEYDAMMDERPAENVWIVVRDASVAGGQAELILVVDQ